MKQEITYATTDLNIWATNDLTPIADQLVHLGLFTYYVGPGQDSSWFARLACAESFPDPDSSIAVMLTAIEALDEPARMLWSACTSRDFDIGYYCGDSPWAFNQQLLPSTIARIAAASAGIVITIYPVIETDAAIAAVAILKKDKWVRSHIGKYINYGTHYTDLDSVKETQVKVTLFGKAGSIIVNCLMHLTVDGKWEIKEIIQKEVKT
jgi:hypothetical protein